MKWGGWIIKPLTVVKLLTTNDINPTNINNTNNHCWWLSCIVGGGLWYEYGYMDMEKYGEIYMKSIWENENENLYIFEYYY